MVVIIDRTEGDFAVVELPDKSTVNVPLVLFENPKEGQAYIIEKSENPVSERVEKLMDEVFND